MIDGKVVGCPHHILEPQRTNLWTNSNLSASISLDGLTRTLNQSVSPSGDIDANLFNETATTGTHRFYRLDIPSTSTDFSMSFFAKKNGINIIRIVAQGGTKYADFDLSLGTVGNESGINSSAIEDYGNGWYRCVINVTATGWVGLYALNDSSQNSYLGNVSKGVYLYGAQLEQGSYATSYIPTNGSTVTRSAETANGSGDADTFNDSEGVLMTEISALSDDSTNRIFGISNNSNFNESILLRYSNNSNEIIAQVRKGGVYEFSMTHTLNDSTLFSKIAFKYKQNDFSLFVNGFEVDTSPTGDIITGLDTLSLSYVGGNQFYGNTKQIQYYNSALTDSELEKISSWTSFTDMANGQLYTIE